MPVLLPVIKITLIGLNLPRSLNGIVSNERKYHSGRYGSKLEAKGFGVYNAGPTIDKSHQGAEYAVSKHATGCPEERFGIGRIDGLYDTGVGAAGSGTGRDSRAVHGCTGKRELH